MSENITVASTCLPPSAKPVTSRSSATSAVANFRNSSRCWSRRRFFSRLAATRARSSTPLTRLSSTTRRSPLSALRSRLTLHLLQRPRHSVALGGETLHASGRPVQSPGLRQHFEIPGEGGERQRAEARRVGLERVRG